MNKALIVFCGAVVICSAGNAFAHPASPDEERIGTHLWARTYGSACPTPEVACGIDIWMRPGTEVTVMGVAFGPYGFQRYLQVRLNTGQVGFAPDVGNWDTEDPQIAVRKRQEESRQRMAKSEAELHAQFAKEAAEMKEYNDAEQRCIDDLRSKLRIGMSAAEVRTGIRCDPHWQPWHVNETTTAFGTREQWVYRRPPDGRLYAYLYFEDGRLVAIQK
jgi:hypothetical protein